VVQILLRTSLKFAIPLAFVVLLLSIGAYRVISSPGNAEFWRTRNFVSFELLRTMGVDLLKLRNYQSFELTRTMNADVTKLRNYQTYELIRTMNADVTKLRNYEAFQMLDPGELGLTIDIGPILVTDQNGSIRSTFDRGDIVQFGFGFVCVWG